MAEEVDVVAFCGRRAAMFMGIQQAHAYPQLLHVPQDEHSCAEYAFYRGSGCVDEETFGE